MNQSRLLRIQNKNPPSRVLGTPPLQRRFYSNVSILNMRSSRSLSQPECSSMDLLEPEKPSSPRSSPKSSDVDSSRRIWENSDPPISIRQPRISGIFSHEPRKQPNMNQSFSFSMRSILSSPLVRTMSMPTRRKKSVNSSRSSMRSKTHRISS